MAYGIGYSVSSGSRSSLSFNDLLIYLCLHGSRHGWERLAWVCDINELIRSRQDIDWDLLFTESKRLGCENVVVLGLRLIREFFGFNIPAGDWKKINGDNKLYDSMIDEIRDEHLKSLTLR